MADSLDDFFAKKDKKRSKDKGKAVLSAEALVRELEEGSKQLDFPVRKETKTSTAIELLGLDADDGDWRDFEDVEKRDYTGLKVKEMSLQDQNEDEQRRLSSEQLEPISDSSAWKVKDETSTGASELIPSANQKANISQVSVSTSKSSDTATTTLSSTIKQHTTEKPQNLDAETIATKDSSSSDSTQKKGDTKSAKKAYVPPAERNLASGEFKVLEPVKLSKSKSSGIRQGAIIKLDEENFPSLG